MRPAWHICLSVSAAPCNIQLVPSSHRHSWDIFYPLSTRYYIVNYINTHNYLLKYEFVRVNESKLTAICPTASYKFNALFKPSGFQRWQLDPRWKTISLMFYSLRDVQNIRASICCTCAMAHCNKIRPCFTLYSWIRSHVDYHLHILPPNRLMKCTPQFMEFAAYVLLAEWSFVALTKLSSTFTQPRIQHDMLKGLESTLLFLYQKPLKSEGWVERVHCRNCVVQCFSVLFPKPYSFPFEVTAADHCT